MNIIFDKGADCCTPSINEEARNMRLWDMTLIKPYFEKLAELVEKAAKKENITVDQWLEKYREELKTTVLKAML